MKRIMMFMLVLFVALGLSLNISYAEDSSAVQYINSEESKNFELEDLLRTNENIQITDDGRYQKGVPGEYNVKYHKNSDPYSEQSCKIIVVESQGTVIDIEAVDGNVKVVDDESKINNTTLKEFSDNLLVTITIKKKDGSIHKVQTHVVNDYSGAGGGPIDEYGSVAYGSGFTSAEAYPYWMQSRAINANQVKYYNPVDEETGDENFITLWLVYFAKGNSNIITSDNQEITVQAPDVGAGDDLKLKTNHISLTDEMQSQIGANKYKGYNISLTDAENNSYQIDKGIKLTMKVPENMNKNKVAVYRVDGTQFNEIKSNLKDDSVIFEAPVLPAQYVIIEKDVNTTDKPEDNKNATTDGGITVKPNDDQKIDAGNHTQQNNSVKSGTVKTADSNQLLLYLGCSFLALFGLICVKKIHRIK